MLMLRLRQAQCALADGRLDEAHRLLEEPALRDHRKGQRLVARLARRFGDRARDHLEAGQPRAALADCGRAIALEGPTPDRVALRDEADAALAGNRAAHARRAATKRAAREQLERGRLTLAEGLLDGTDADDHGDLRRQAAAHRQAASPLVDRARAAFKRGDLEGAIEALREARRWHAGDARLAALSRRVAVAAYDRARSYLRHGRPALARQFADRAEGLDASTMEAAALQEALDLAARASADLRRGRFRACEATLAQLARTEPKAVWIKEAAAVAGRAAQELEQLRAGPLAEFTPARVERRPHRVRPATADTDRFNPPPLESGSTMRPPRGANGIPGTPTVPDPFILTIDGAGSYVVFTAAQVRVGPISAPTPPDLPLVTDPSTPTATVQRVDGGYVVRAEHPIHVGDQPTTERLLRSGDVAALSSRCRMTLTQPHPASGTALLRFSGARLPRADVRGAVLMDRELLLGPTAPAHLVSGGLHAPVALVASERGITLGGSAGARTKGEPLPLDQTVDLGGATITISRFA